MVEVRGDLNGSRLYVPGRPELWFIIHGLRRHVASPVVHDALFSNADHHTSVSSVDNIRRGPDLNDGTCLIRGDGKDEGIYLLTGFPTSEVRRHHITSWETFLAYGFDSRLVRAIPGLALAAVPVGLSLRLATPKRAGPAALQPAGGMIDQAAR